MFLYQNELYRADLLRAAKANDFSALSGKTVLLTGASGLIGTAVTDLLLSYNREHHADIRVIAAVYDYNETVERFDPDPHLSIVYYNAFDPVTFDFKADAIIHAASNASPDAYVRDPVGTMMANYMGIYELLKYGTRCGAQKVLYISSSEVYGKKEHPGAFKEDEYGYVDILNVRASYPMGKRSAETLCVSYAQQYGANVSIVRPGHIYGPTALPTDRRVSSMFAYQAAKGEPLILKSAGTQRRSYCYTVDCASAILRVLASGENCGAYNISNRDSIITIREMAQYYAEAGGVALQAEAATSEEQAAFNPMDDSSLNSEKLESLGWTGLFSAEEGLSHTVAILRECLSE